MKNPLVTRAHFYTLLTGVCALCEAERSDTRMSELFCVTPFRTRGCIPCDACASIPVHFAAETVCWRRPFPPQSLKIHIVIKTVYRKRRRSFCIYPSHHLSVRRLKSCTKKKSKSCKPKRKRSSVSLRRSSTKSNGLKTAPPTMKRVIAASGRTGLSPVVQRLRVSHRR